MIDTYFIFLTFLVSSFFVLISVQLTLKFENLISRKDSFGIQKLHMKPTSRIGGVSVFLAFSIGLMSINENSSLLIFFWLSLLPVFVIGLIEDITLKVSPRMRLFFTSISILVAYIWVNISVNSFGFYWVDRLFFDFPILGLIFTLGILAGAVNSLNIIDGVNGLLGGYAILASLAIAYVAYSFSDILIIQLCLTLAASILGFFIFNFPFGKIFMGDGGSYLTGFSLAILGLMLVDRHEELSYWFVLLIFIYPMYELLFSIYRRKIIYKVNAIQPDAKHLHSLIYKKLISSNRFKHNQVLCNSMTSPFLWFLSLIGIIPAVVWHSNQTLLIISACVFMLIYSVIYKVISSNKIV